MQNHKSNDIVFHYVVPDSNREEILSAITYLQQEISEIDHYPDKSLFFQNPLILDGWLLLVRAIENNTIKDLPERFEDIDEWANRTEPFVTFLLTMRELHYKYKNLYKEYYDQLHGLLECYGGWLEGECISTDAMEVLSVDKYENDIEGVEDIVQHLKELKKNSLNARASVHTVLSDYFSLLIAIMNRGGQIVINMLPSVDAFAKAMDYDLKEWTRHFGKDMFKEMKEDLNRHYKEHRTDRYTPELWGEMLSADEDALIKAKVQQLADCNESKQEHWGEDMKAQMDENGKLMQQILSSCHTEELLDFGEAENVEPFIELLTPSNLDMFYEIIVRRSIIQCEMFPELKIQHDEWMNNDKKQPEEDEKTGLSAARHSKMNEIIGILQKGNWKLPATADNIELLLNTVFGKDKSLLDDEDIKQCEVMWSLVEKGRGNRMVIIPANLAGYFAEESLLVGSPKEISDELFGKNCNQTNSINDGKSNNCSGAFGAVIPFLKKYIDKIIRQV
jgi:hypothetical protein